MKHPITKMAAVGAESSQGPTSDATNSTEIPAQDVTTSALSEAALPSAKALGAEAIAERSEAAGSSDGTKAGMPGLAKQAEQKQVEEEIPPALQSSVLSQIFADPVLVNCSKDCSTAIEREAALTWINEHDTCPNCGSKLANHNLVALRDKKQAVEQYLLQHPEKMADQHFSKAVFAEKIKLGEIEFLRNLLKYNAEARKAVVNNEVLRPETGQTALHIAVDRTSMKREEMLTLLLSDFSVKKVGDNLGPDSDETRHADPNLPNAMGRTPLHIVAIAGDDARVGILLQKGANPNCFDHEGLTPLYHAVKANHLQTAQVLLLAHDNTTVFSQDDYRQTPLMLAVFAERVEMVQAFFASARSGKNIGINLRNSQGISALVMASVAENQGIFDAFVAQQKLLEVAAGDIQLLEKLPNCAPERLAFLHSLLPEVSSRQNIGQGQKERHDEITTPLLEVVVSDKAFEGEGADKADVTGHSANSSKNRMVPTSGASDRGSSTFFSGCCQTLRNCRPRIHIDPCSVMGSLIGLGVAAGLVWSSIFFYKKTNDCIKSKYNGCSTGDVISDIFMCIVLDGIALGLISCATDPKGTLGCRNEPSLYASDQGTAPTALPVETATTDISASDLITIEKLGLKNPGMKVVRMRDQPQSSSAAEDLGAGAGTALTNPPANRV